MHNEKTEIKKFFGLIIVLLPLLIIPKILSGGEADKKAENNSEIQGNYVLKIKGDFISLKAKDASLKDILEEIGRRMKIEVVAKIPREEKITIDFDMMYLGDAIKRFKTNYAYITESEKEKGKISKIVTVPEDEGKAFPAIQKNEQDSQPPIQEYNPQPPIQEYNPQPPIQKFEHEPQPTTVRPENESQPSSILNKNNPQTSDVGSENNPQTPDVGSENNPQTPDTGSENNSQTPNTGSEYNPQPSMQ